MIQVIIVDDHMMTRLGIKSFIEEDPDIKVVAEADNGEQAMELCAAVETDVIIMDINMPKISGIETMKAILLKKPHTKFLMLTGSGSLVEIQESLAAGARGYCLKDINYKHLIQAIKNIVAGETWIDEAIFKEFSEQLKNQPYRKKFISHSYNLSDREKQILRLVVEGGTNQKIAQELNISIDTVKTHLKAIMIKLMVGDRTQAAVKAVREKLV